MIELSKVELFAIASQKEGALNYLAKYYSLLNDPIVTAMSVNNFSPLQVAQLISIGTRNIFNCPSNKNALPMMSIATQPRTFEQAVECLAQNIKSILKAILIESSFDDMILHWDTDNRALELWNLNFFNLKSRFASEKFQVIKKIEAVLAGIMDAIERYNLDLENLPSFKQIETVDLNSFFDLFNPDHHMKPRVEPINKESSIKPSNPTRLKIIIPSVIFVTLALVGAAGLLLRKQIVRFLSKRLEKSSSKVQNP
jgi:hypothetical protein